MNERMQMNVRLSSFYFFILGFMKDCPSLIQLFIVFLISFFNEDSPYSTSTSMATVSSILQNF